MTLIMTYVEKGVQLILGKAKEYQAELAKRKWAKLGNLIAMGNEISQNTAKRSNKTNSIGTCRCMTSSLHLSLGRYASTILTNGECAKL